MSFNRSLAVKKQWRDRKGRWVEMGKGVRFFNVSTGKFELGTFTGPDSNGNARIKLPNGNYVSVPRSSVESYSVKGTLNRVKDKIRQTFKKASLKKAGISTDPKYLELAEMPSTPLEKKKFSELPDGTHFTLPHRDNEDSISRNMPLFTKNSANDNKVVISDSDNYRALIAGKEDTRVSVSTSKDKESFSVSAKVNDDDEVFVFDDKALNDFAELNPHSTITQTAANDKSDNLKGATYDKDGNLTLPESAKPTDGKDIKTHDTFYIPADENLSTGSRTLKTEDDGIPASGLVVDATSNYITYLDDKDVEKTIAKDNLKVHLQNETAEDRAIENGTISREKHSQALPVDVDPNTPEYENTLHTAEGVPGKSNPTRIINDTQPPQTQIQDQTQTQPQKKSIPTSLDDFPDIKRNKPEVLEGESYAPTQEQQDVIDAVLAGKNVKVQALAGAGKTSTVEALARRLQKDEPKSRGIYIAFNKSVQTEAEGRMPKNVEPRTGHSLAYAWANKDSKARTLIDKIQKRDAHKNFTPLKKNSDIADHLGIDDLPESGDADLDEATEAVRKRSSITSGVVEAIKNFQVSADDEISEKHLPTRMSSLTAEQKEVVVGHVQKYWDDMNSPEGKLPITHDTYRKAWALSKPDLGSPSKGGGKRKANLLFLDEAQDTPPVLAKVIADQNMRKVLIGDQNQAIYGFSGATDYLSEADADVELPLSQSFRFGPKVADAGNRFLQLLKAPHRVKGGGPESSIIKGMEDADAVLVRSNRGLIAEAIKELSAGRTVSTPKGTKTNLMSLVDSAIYLKGGYKKRPYNMHEDFDAFNSWNEVVAEINSTGNQTLKNYQGLFDSLEINGEMGLPALYNLKDLVNTIREPSNESEMVDMFRKDGELILKDRAKIGKFQNSPIEKLSLEMAKRNGAKAKYEKGKYHEYVQALEEQGGLKSRGWAYDPKQDHWKFLGDDIDAEEKQMKYDLFGLGDVTISTAHKSKGLEWDRVRISDDFSKPEIDENTGEEVFPSDEELMLSYVAVTRAKKELDPGGLDWVYDRTDENGGVKVKEDSSDKAQETHSESDIDPVSTSTDTTEDVDSSIFDAPEVSDSDSDSDSDVNALKDADLPEDSDSDPNEPEDVDLPETSEPEEQEPAPEPEPEPEPKPQPEKKNEEEEEPLQRGDVVTDSHGREWNVLAVSKKGNVIVKNEDGDYESFNKDEVSKNEPTPTPEPEPEPTPEPAPKPEEEAETLSTYRQNAKNMPTDVEGLEKYMNQTSGSNPGGFYVDPETGRKFYVKKSKSLDHARNEALASEFYSEMGIKNAEQHVIIMPDGSAGTISELVPNAKEDLNTKVHGDQDYLSEIYKGFAADVFLANWDVAGLVYDNIVTDDKGDPVRVDPGGALKYRAQGSPKGNLFGDEATEWDTLRDSSMNYSSSVVFKNMTDEELFKSAERVSALTDDKIDDLVTGQMGHTPEAQELVDKLKKRRDDIRERANGLGVGTLPEGGDTSESDSSADTANDIESQADADTNTDTGTETETETETETGDDSAEETSTPVGDAPEPAYNPETNKYSEDALNSLSSYLDNSDDLNFYLREGKYSIPESKVEKVEKDLANLKSLMDDIDPDETIYRGVFLTDSDNSPVVDLIQALNTPGAIIQNNGFSSTSLDKGVAESFGVIHSIHESTEYIDGAPSKVLMSITPKGAKGHKVDYDALGSDDFSHEKEVILDDNTVFVVDSVEIKKGTSGQEYADVKVSAYDKSALEDGTIENNYPDINIAEVGDPDVQGQDSAGGQESEEISVPQGDEDSVSSETESTEETEVSTNPSDIVLGAEKNSLIAITTKYDNGSLTTLYRKADDDPEGKWKRLDDATGKDDSYPAVSSNGILNFLDSQGKVSVHDLGKHSDYFGNDSDSQSQDSGTSADDSTTPEADSSGSTDAGTESTPASDDSSLEESGYEPKPEGSQKGKVTVDDDGNPLDANGNAIKKGSNVKLYKANGDLWIEGTVAAISGDKKRVKVIDSATGKASYRLPHKIHVDSDGQADVLPESPYKTEQKVNEALAGLEDGDHINIHNTDTSYTKQTNKEGDPVFVEDGSDDVISLNDVVDNNSETKTDNGVSYSNLTFSPESAEVSPKSQDGGESHPSLPENMGVDSLGFQYIKNSEGTKMFIGDTVEDKKGNLIGKIVAFDGGKLLGKRLKVERPDGTFSYRKPEALFIVTPPEDEDLPKPTTLIMSDVDDEPTPPQTGGDTPFNILPESERGASGDGYHKSGPWGKFGASGLMITADDPMTGETNYLLVQRGNSLSSNKGKWQLPGGALDENETIYQGAARETHEEIGLTQEQLNDLELVGEHTTDNGEGWSYSNIAVKSKDMFIPTATDSESGKVSWFTYDEIQEMKNKGDLVPAFADSIDDVLDLFGDNKSKPESDDDQDTEPSDDDFSDFWDLADEIAKEEEAEEESLETSNEVEGVDFVYGKDGSVIKENDIVSWPSQKKTGQVVGIYNENKITVNFDGTLKNLNPKQKLQASLEKPVEDVPEGMPVEPDLTDLDNQIKALEDEAQLDYSVQELEDDFEHMFNVVKKHNSTKSSYKDAYHYTMHGHKLVEKSGTPEELKENAKFMNTKNLLSDEMLDKLNASIDKSIKANEENEKKMNELLDEKQSLLSEYKKEKMEWAKANNIKVAHPFNQNAVPTTSGDKSSNNPKNWSQAVGKTANLEDSIEHMINNPKSAANGVSILLDSAQVENLQMRVTGYTDKDGNKKFHTRFNISQDKQKEFANNLVKKFGAKNVTTTTGGKFSTKKIDENGEMVEYENTYGSPEDSTAKTQIIHLDDGTIIRYSFDGKKDKGFSNVQQSSVFNGRVEIITDQENKSEQISKALEAINLDKPKPSSVDDVKRTAAKLLMERLSGTFDIDGKHPTDEQLNTYMGVVEKEYGITYEDIQVSMDDLGNTVFMLSQDGLDKIKKKYKGLPKAFKHSITGSDGIISMMTSSSPGVVSTYNRWESGIQVGGMSSYADMLTGGAKYVFTRPVKSQDSSTGLFIDPDSVLRNLGSHYSGNDIYGKTIKGSTLWSDLSSHKGKYPASAETIIPNGLDVSTWMYFTVGSTYQRDTYISKLKKLGYNEINGIPIEKFIRTSDMPFPTKEDITETVSDNNAITLPAGEIGASTP